MQVITFLINFISLFFARKQLTRDIMAKVINRLIGEFMNQADWKKIIQFNNELHQKIFQYQLVDFKEFYKDTLKECINQEA